MKLQQPPKLPSPWDRLITRPEDHLPTPQDPKSPRGWPADPKELPRPGQGMDPKAGDIDYTA